MVFAQCMSESSRGQAAVGAERVETKVSAMFFVSIRPPGRRNDPYRRHMEEEKTGTKREKFRDEFLDENVKHVYEERKRGRAEPCCVTQ